MSNITIYILELENNKYYIGRSNDPNNRIYKHFSNRGSTWTKLYKPLNIMKTYNNCDIFDEDKYTIQLMSIYGIDNVRGGSFVMSKRRLIYVIMNIK